MVLTVAVRNSEIRFGGFTGGQIRFAAAIATDHRMTAYQYMSAFSQAFSLFDAGKNGFSGAILSSVVPLLTDRICQALRHFVPQVTVVGPGVRTGLNIKVHNALGLGTDLVTDCVCAVREYPLPCVIFDLEAATAAAVLDDAGNLLGTSIMPGLMTSLYGLRHETALLPEVRLQAPDSPIGINTDEALRSGLLYGMASMVDGMAARLSEGLGKACSFLLTGPYAEHILPNCRQEYRYDPDLSLKGLHYIYLKNLRQ
ncbi:MAG TPA: type III pantothenate kinase [Firmicutes bacterium]|nr:type III pantothenate kinase [Bacillota bacterium]